MVGVLYQDDPDDARAFLARYGATGYDHVVDEGGRLAIDFGVTGPPESYFVDAGGIVRAKQFGPLNRGAHGRAPGRDRDFPMRKQLPAIAVGAVLALLAILAILWLAPVAATDADRADALAAELRCPDCQGLSVADSQTASAREIRRQVDELVASGATDDDVRAHFVDRYGEWILLAPTSPVAWLLPFAALALGVAVLAAWLVRGGARHPRRTFALDDETRRRLHEEAETLDA